MDLFNSLIGLIEFLIAAAVISAVLLVVLLVVVSLLPRDNPLHRLLMALCKRLGLMLGLGVFALGTEWIPFIDLIIDAASFVINAWYWLKLIPEARDILSESRRPRATALPDRRPPAYRVPAIEDVHAEEPDAVLLPAPCRREP